MFRNNRIVRAICPWQSWAGNVAVRRLAILNNLSDEAFDPGGGNAYTRGSVGLFLSSKALPIEDLWLEHNTVAKAQRGIVIGLGSNMPRLTIRNNAFPHGPAIEGPWVWKDEHNPAGPYASVTAITPDRDIVKNALFGAPPQNIRYDDKEFKVWPSAKAAGIDADGRLLESSALKRAATDGTDIGVDFAALEAAQAPAR
jgi:hypothetical protein